MSDFWEEQRALAGDENQCAGCGDREEKAFLFCLICIQKNKPLPVPYPCLFSENQHNTGPYATATRTYTGEQKQIDRWQVKQ